MAPSLPDIQQDGLRCRATCLSHFSINVPSSPEYNDRQLHCAGRIMTFAALNWRNQTFVGYPRLLCNFADTLAAFANFLDCCGLKCCGISCNIHFIHFISVRYYYVSADAWWSPRDLANSPRVRAWMCMGTINSVVMPWLRGSLQQFAILNANCFASARKIKLYLDKVGYSKAVRNCYRQGFRLKLSCSASDQPMVLVTLQ